VPKINKNIRKMSVHPLSSSLSLILGLVKEKSRRPNTRKITMGKGKIIVASSQIINSVPVSLCDSIRSSAPTINSNNIPFGLYRALLQRLTQGEYRMDA
jgi:hypothetical protein